MQPRARAVMLSNYHEVARFVGLDPFIMLGRAGVHPSALRDPENWLPGTRVLHLLRESAVRSGRDDFSVLLGESRTFASLGPVSLLLRHEATLRHIIEAAHEYRRLINELVHTNLRVNGREAVFEWNLIPGLSSSQGVSLLATIAYRVLVDGAGVDWQPECIHFRDRKPRHIATYRRVFDCPIEFDSEFDGLSFRASCLDLPNAYAQPELATHARRLLDLMPGVRIEDTVVDRTKRVIPLLLSNGQADVAEVAAYLDVPVRVLQRKLTAEGASFRVLLNECRRELAVRYLRNSNHPLTTVGQLTGFSALSSFSRWFTTEFGMPPAKWRREMSDRDRVHLDAHATAVAA